MHYANTATFLILPYAKINFVFVAVFIFLQHGAQEIARNVF